MPYAKPDALVSTEWLEGHLRSPGVRVVDASWFFPNTDKTGRTEFEREHIPEAVFFDIDEIAAPKVATHMMPDIRRFTQRVTDLGPGQRQSHRRLRSRRWRFGRGPRLVHVPQLRP